MGEALIKKVEIQKKVDFNNFLDSGGKLSYMELRNLNSVFKEEYVKMILKEDDAMQNYMEISQDNLQNAFDELTLMM